MHTDTRWMVADESSLYVLWRDIDLSNGKESPSWRHHTIVRQHKKTYNFPMVLV